ncbi:MAG: hypothetical protein U9R11_04205, partial [Chloroflexota bacterium]|nr:hypothetical protein [Chloroflexota bacterium]
EWDNKNHIGIWWDTAGTDDTSGVLGYSWDLTQSAFDRPDEDFDAYIGTYGASEYAHTDGTWYFHFMTGDVAGNWANPVHLGPYLIDASPPTTPTLVSSSHTVGGWSTDNTIEVSWTSSDEGGSGIAGYSYQWSRFTTTLLDTTIDTTDSFTTSDPLDDARWYLVVRAIDGAGSSSGVAAFGPFGVDTRPPGSGEIHSPEFAYSPSFAVHWSYQDGGSGVLNYDVRFSDDGRVSWTDWLTNTTLTSATFADGQNWHTYYFSVRARDELGNLSSYYPESHTLVKIPPHVTGFSPASGFAGAGQSSSPLQLVPGSMVDITGIGFTEGSVTFNSVPWDHVHSQVVDDTHIRAAVGAGTSGSGPVCVHTSLGDDCSNILFTVVPDKPFPVRWGLGFDNFSTRSSGMGWGIFEKAFGKCEVNTCVSSYLGIPVPCRWCPDWALVPRPDTGLFFFASRGIAKGGDCYGISYLTMDFYKGMKDPDDFAAGADVPASLSWHTPNLADEIRARQWRQLSIENLSFEVGQVLLYELAGPVRMRTWMETQWALGQPTMLCMEHGSEGHCVNPYEVVGDNIHLYDNNYPYINNNYPQGGDGCTGHDYLDQALERFIDVDTAHWSYPGASCEPGNWGGDWPGQYIIGLPYAVVAGPHHPLSDLLGMDALFFGSDGAAHSIVEDAEGRIIGYDESGQLTQTIPITDAMPIIPFQDGAPPFEGYYLSEGGNYTVHVNGISSGTYSTTLLADGGTTFVVEDVPLKPDTHDGLGFDRGDGSPTGESLFTLTTTDSGKDVSATIVRPADGGSEQRRCSVNNLTIGDGAPLTMTTDGEADSLVISGGAGSTYDVCFYRLAEGQVPGEFCWGGINLGAGDRHILTPQDWDRLGSTQVRLDIDEGGDGTVDETQWLVGHGLALSMHGEPTVIHSGDLLTYTLIYTITGEEVAPGVVLTSTVPISTTFVDATGGVTPQEGALTWILGSLTPPASGQEAFTVKVGSVPEDTIVGTMAYLRDESGRWAMAGSTSAGPAYPAHRIYLPIIVKRYSH